MSDELVFGSEVPDEGIREQPSFLSPAVCAVAAFALAVTALLAQNVLTIGIQVLLRPQLSSEDGITSYYVVLGVAAMAQALLAVPLGLRGFRAEARWEANLGRAAVLLAVVPLLSGAATIVGAIVHGDSVA